MPRFSQLKLAIFASFSLSLPFAHADSPNWPTFRNGWLNSGRSSFALRVPEATRAGEDASVFELGGLIWATPVIDEQGNVYVGSSNKRFFSFGPEGKARWTATLFDRPDSLIDSAAALAPGGQVIVPGGDGDLHSFDRQTGQALWNFHAYGVSDASHQAGAQVNSFEGNVQVGPNGWIYAGSDNGTLYCLDAQGHEQWHFLTGMMIWSSPAFASSGEWLAFGSLDGHLYLLNPRSGALLAKLNVGSDVKASVSTDGRDHLYFGASDGKFRAVQVVKHADSTFGLREEWTFKTHLEIYSSAALSDDTVYFGSMDGHLYALDLQHGKARWDYATYSPVASSPLLTSDGALLAGAANGKLYAIDAHLGTRLWSFQSSPSTSQKANLDSSPALDASGGIWVGSYQGRLHRIGARHCFVHPDDTRCEFGGSGDTPAFGVSPLPTEGAYLRYEDPRGRYGAQATTRVGRSQPLHLRLAVYHGGKFESSAAISTSDVNVTAWKDGVPLASGELVWSVSSDGKYLNFQPAGFFEGGAHYRVRIRGHYFGQSDWLTDRLQWLTLHSFEDSFEFDTEPKGPAPRSQAVSPGWFLHSLYLTQPKALDTYIPAALDGQAFVVKPFGLDGDSRFFLAVLPALPTESGFTLLAEPTRATAIEASVSGDSIRARGAFHISAMGGEIPFKDFELAAGINPDGSMRGGQLRAVASCLSMQGNGSSYHFPWALVDQVCDPYLKMIAYLVFGSDRLPADQPQSLLQALVTTPPGAGDGELLLTSAAGAGWVPGDRLLTAITYDSVTREIVDRQFAKVTLQAGQSEVRLTLKGFAQATRGRHWALQAFLGADAADAVSSSNTATGP